MGMFISLSARLEKVLRTLWAALTILFVFTIGSVASAQAVTVANTIILDHHAQAYSLGTNVDYLLQPFETIHSSAIDGSWRSNEKTMLNFGYQRQGAWS
jgi:hypothetical protein